MSNEDSSGATVSYARGSSGRAPWILMGVGFVILLLGTAAMVSDPSPLAAPFFLLGGIQIAAGLLFSRRLRIVDETLRIPRGAATVRIPLRDIAGVGLRFMRALPPSRVRTGWYLTVWDGTGQLHRTGLAWFPKRYPGSTDAEAQLGMMPTGFNAATDTDFDELAATPAGTAARDVYRRALAAQGHSGPLETRQQQKHAAVAHSLHQDTAFWSPDGTHGPIA